MFFELGFPKREVWKVGDERYLARIKQMNSLSHVFVSVYNYEKVKVERGTCDYSTAVLDLMVFDLDPYDLFNNRKMRFYESLLKIHTTLLKLGIMHKVHFSGNGFHLYVRFKEPYRTTSGYAEDEKKRMLRLAQEYVLTQCRLDDGRLPEVDVHILGNIAQMIRIPNTMNPKSKLYCIPLRHEEIIAGLEVVRELAKEQRINGGNYWMGEKPLDINALSGYVTGIEGELAQSMREAGGNYDLTVKFDDTFLATVPACVANILKKGWTSWEEFFMVAVYFKEKGMPYEACEQVIRRYLIVPRRHSSCGSTHTDAGHMLGEGCRRRQNSLKMIYDTLGTSRDYTFPSCRKIRGMGVCPFKTDAECNCKIYE